jgi:RNA polymerase sigma-70 factor (ECF subfamily)
MGKASDEPGGHEHPHSALVRALAAACETTDVVALASLLDPDVSVVVDGGGRAGITAEPARGIGYGVGLLLRVLATQPCSTVAEHAVNGRPGLIVSRDHLVVAVISLELRRRRVQDVWIVLNPEKLERWNRS